MAAAACREVGLATLAAAIVVLVFPNSRVASAAVAGLAWTPTLSTARPLECLSGRDTCRSGMSIANASLMQVTSEQLRDRAKGLDRVKQVLLSESEGKSRESGGSGSNIASTMPSRSSISMGGGIAVGMSASMPPSAYPHEPLLDEDYIYDANNSLEDYTHKKTTHGDSGKANTTHADNNQDLSELVGDPSCVTRADPRAVANGYTTAKPGTPCVFGLDIRDEGKHCVLDPEYGSFGWCYTDDDRESFGSCSEDCPMFGPHGVLQSKLDAMDEAVSIILDKMDKMNKTDSQGGEDKDGDSKKKDKAKRKTMKK